jgi:hypothetical protein
MTKLTVHNPKSAIQLVMSLMSFTQNVKFDIEQRGLEAGIQCDNPTHLRLFITSNVITADKETSICIKEIQRLHRALSMVNEYTSDLASFNMAVSDRQDQLSYDDGRLKFRIGMVNEKAIGESIDKKAMPPTSNAAYSMVIQCDGIKSLFRQTTIVRSKEAKIYLIQNPDGSVSGQYEDKKQAFCGMVAVPLAEKEMITGSFAPSVISANKFHNLIKMPGDKITLYQLANEMYLAESEYVEGCNYVKAQMVFSPTVDGVK